MSAPATVYGGSSGIPHGSCSSTSCRKVKSRVSAMEISCQTSALRSAWALWITQHYRGATDEQIGKAFGVSERTVRYWLDQMTSPRGEHLWTAVQRDGFVIPKLHRRETCAASNGSTGRGSTG